MFQKPFYHVFLPVSKSITKTMANVFVALYRKVPHSRYSWNYSQPCPLIHMEYQEQSMLISHFFFQVHTELEFIFENKKTQTSSKLFCSFCVP